MPFDVGQTINSIADSFLRAPLISAISRNPVYTAVVMTFVVVVITLLIFRDVDAQESILIMSLRSGFWVFVFLLGILFVHNKNLSAEINVNQRDATIDTVFRAAHDDTLRLFEDSVVPVKPLSNVQ